MADTKRIVFESVPVDNYNYNFHTHTLFCDGKNTASEMAESAFQSDIKTLGFSAHAIFPATSCWHLPVEKYADYCAEIKKIKKAYRGKMDILLGFEADYFPGLSEPDRKTYRAFNPDFIIGSVHYILGKSEGKAEEPYVTEKQNLYKIPSDTFAVDGSVDELEKGLMKVFNGDGRALVERYFELEREMALNYDFDIIGHPDLIRKRNGKLHFFDEKASWYKKELKVTAQAFAASGKIVEINTGGMARKALDDTYPSDDFLELLKKEGVKMILNSDSHSSDTITYGFDYAIKKAQRLGLSEFSVLLKH